MNDWELETALQASYQQGWNDSRDSMSNQMRIDEAVESATANLKAKLLDEKLKTSRLSLEVTALKAKLAERSVGELKA